MRLKPLCLMLITDQAWQLEVVVIFGVLYYICPAVQCQPADGPAMGSACSLICRSACAPPILWCASSHHDSCIHASTRCTWCTIDSGLIGCCYPPLPKRRCECGTLQHADWHLVGVGVVGRNVSGARGSWGGCKHCVWLLKDEQWWLTHVRAAALGAWAAASAHPTACSPG